MKQIDAFPPSALPGQADLFDDEPQIAEVEVEKSKHGRAFAFAFAEQAEARRITPAPERSWLHDLI